jgi:uncharacterized membrane protein (DUF485 family)
MAKGFIHAGRTGMAKVDYAAIARHPKFLELSRRKKSFLIGWWVFSTIFYFGLPIWAGNTTLQSDLGNMKVRQAAAVGLRARAVRCAS